MNDETTDEPPVVLTARPMTEEESLQFILDWNAAVEADRKAREEWRRAAMASTVTRNAKGAI